MVHMGYICAAKLQPERLWPMWAPGHAKSANSAQSWPKAAYIKTHQLVRNLALQQLSFLGFARQE